MEHGREEAQWLNSPTYGAHRYFAFSSRAVPVLLDKLDSLRAQLDGMAAARDLAVRQFATAILHGGEHRQWLLDAADRFVAGELQVAPPPRPHRHATLEAALGLDTAWPLLSVLTRLADAADHLLKDHDCDAHGWEEVGYARDAARKIAEVLASI